MIPAELRALPQWLAWKYATRDGRPTKIPLSPHGGAGKSNSPQTWGTYREALGVLDADGLGFVFSADDPYLGVDMDNCVSASGAIHEAAYSIVRKLGGYVEFSPSGRGLHVIVRASLARGRHTMATPWGSELALYDRGRFFTMLGNGRGEIREAQAEVNALVAYYFPEEAPAKAPTGPPKPFSVDDVALVERVLSDPRMADLWQGGTAEHAGDRSAGDLALCAHLAFLTANDPARIDALFRRSSRMRLKWDEPRGDSTYGWMTIERALRGR